MFSSVKPPFTIHFQIGQNTWYIRGTVNRIIVNIYLLMYILGISRKRGKYVRLIVVQGKSKFDCLPLFMFLFSMTMLYKYIIFSACCEIIRSYYVQSRLQV